MRWAATRGGLGHGGPCGPLWRHFPCVKWVGGLVSRGSITNTDSWRQYLHLETLLRRQDFLAKRRCSSQGGGQGGMGGNPCQDVLCRWSQQVIQQMGCRGAGRARPGIPARVPGLSPMGCNTWNVSRAGGDREDPGRLLHTVIQ